MKALHLEKKGIRLFALAESFHKEKLKSILSGVVMRKDLIIDGIVFGRSTIGGNDSTDSILTMVKNLNRNDINLILLDGIIISMYNIIDGDKINNHTGLPVIAISFNDSFGINQSIKNYFPENFALKLDQLQKSGKRDKIVLKTGKALWIRHWGIELFDSIRILDSFTIQGAIPEPIKIAKILSRAYLATI